MLTSKKGLSTAMRRLVICSTCKFSPQQKCAADGRTGGQMLLEAMSEVLARQGRHDVTVVAQECLWNCDRPCSVILQDDQRFSYVTGSHTPDAEQAEALLQWFDLHGATDNGLVPFRQWPQKMRGRFIARMPPQKSGQLP